MYLDSISISISVSISISIYIIYIYIYRFFSFYAVRERKQASGKRVAERELVPCASVLQVGGIRLVS